MIFKKSQEKEAFSLTLELETHLEQTLKGRRLEVGKMARWLRVLASLAENKVLVASTGWQLTSASHSGARGSVTLYWPSQVLPRMVNMFR